MTSTAQSTEQLGTALIMAIAGQDRDQISSLAANPETPLCRFLNNNGVYEDPLSVTINAPADIFLLVADAAFDRMESNPDGPINKKTFKKLLADAIAANKPGHAEILFARGYSPTFDDFLAALHTQNIALIEKVHGLRPKILGQEKQEPWLRTRYVRDDRTPLAIAATSKCARSAAWIIDQDPESLNDLQKNTSIAASLTGLLGYDKTGQYAAILSAVVSHARFDPNIGTEPLLKLLPQLPDPLRRDCQARLAAENGFGVPVNWNIPGLLEHYVRSENAEALQWLLQRPEYARFAPHKDDSARLFAHQPPRRIRKILSQHGYKKSWSKKDKAAILAAAVIIGLVAWYGLPAKPKKILPKEPGIKQPENKKPPAGTVKAAHEIIAHAAKSRYL